MKKLLLLLLFAFASLPFTSSAEEGKIAIQHKPIFDQTTGLAALDFDILLTEITPENIGLFSPSDLQKVDKEQKNYQANKWLTLQTVNIKPLDTAPNTVFGSLVHQQSFSAKLSFGRFNATTTIDGNNQSLLSDSRFQLSSSFDIIDRNQFTLSVTAQVEQANHQVVDVYMGYTDFAKSNESAFSADITNTSIGIVGTFKLTPNWKVSGGVSSTDLDNSIKQSPLVNSGSLKMAELKTSYSF